MQAGAFLRNVCLSQPGYSCRRGKLELNILNMHVNYVHCRNSVCPNDVQTERQLCTYQYISVKLGLGIVGIIAIGYLNLIFLRNFMCS